MNVPVRVPDAVTTTQPILPERMAPSAVEHRQASLIEQSRLDWRVDWIGLDWIGLHHKIRASWTVGSDGVFTAAKQARLTHPHLHHHLTLQDVPSMMRDWWWSRLWAL